MEIKNYKSQISGSLLGFFDLQVPKWGNLIIHGCSLFQKEGRKWFSFPSKKVTSQDPTAKPTYFAHLRFEDKDIRDKFNDTVIAALDKYFAENQAKATQAQTQNKKEDDYGDLPF